MLWVWLSIAILAVVGVALIIWRKEGATLQGMAFGARLHPGCAVAEGVLLLLLALAYWLLIARR
jgi:hypothetical protein